MMECGNGGGLSLSNRLTTCTRNRKKDRGIPGTLLIAQHAELSFYHQPSPTHGEAAVHVESSGSRASEG